MNRDVFVIYGGIDRKYNLNVLTPSAIITYGGIRNSYSVSGIDPKYVLFIAYGGIDNKYDEGKRLTSEEFREKFNK